MAALALQLAWPTDFGRRRPRGFSELRSLATSRPCACIPSTCPALSIHSLPLPSSSLSAPAYLSGVPAPWRSFQPAVAAPTVGLRPFLRGREAKASRTSSSSGCSALCSPHGRTDRAAVAATLADGAAEARGPLSSTAAGQRRGRARPPPGPGKPPQPHLLLPSSFLERPLAVMASPWKPLPPVPHAHVASPPHSSSGRAEGTIRCARDRTCSPPLVAIDCRFSGRIRRSPVPPLLPDPVRDPVLEFDKGKGPNCIVIDSSE